MFDRLKSYFRRSTPPRSKSRVAEIAYAMMRAKYDAAQTDATNRQHWANADNLSSRSANSPAVRSTLRARSRYEVANNSYARGMILTLANDTIGTGPRLQMLGEAKEANREIERRFAEWSKAIGLAEKLRTMRMARAQDGEAFAVFITNDALPDVKLDLRLVEADQVATPAMLNVVTNLDREVDGIKFDESGNPVSYSILRAHPGDAGFAAAADTESAENVIHWFRADRPGQARAVPEITPALPLFALLRDFSLATVDAAKTAAAITAVIKTMAGPNTDPQVESTEFAPFDEVEIPRNLMLTLPDGYDISQFKSEHPNSTYAEFVDKILNEIARCLNMPFNVAAGNSAKYNYASGRMDHQVYFKSIQIDQSHCESAILDRIFARWLDEALLLDNYLPKVGAFDAAHQWFWDGREHVDPEKEANAQATRLDSHTTTLAHEYARSGRDWEAELRQRAKEIALMKELGLMPDVAQQQPGQGDRPQDAGDEETADEEETADAA